MIRKLSAGHLVVREALLSIGVSLVLMEPTGSAKKDTEPGVLGRPGVTDRLRSAVYGRTDGREGTPLPDWTGLDWTGPGRAGLGWVTGNTGQLTRECHLEWVT
ncbi:hypothetical protein [Streptomyces scabiei]|uniref:hypothetical protein n=1 Tax=Streptomyces scabiei TaxID=1930 RepID=UPI00117F0466|nr:hypothetical protein [Streptomyces scabiei]